MQNGVSPNDPLVTLAIEGEFAMLETIILEDAQAHLAEIIAALSPEEDLFITQNGRPVAKLVGGKTHRPSPAKARQRSGQAHNSCGRR